MSFLGILPYYIICSSTIIFLHKADALSHELNRRTMITAGTAALSLPPSLITNAVTSPTNLPLQGSGGLVTRVEGIGGGFDLMQPQIERGVNVIYPASMAGTWKCNRFVTSIEGDTGQAEIAWRNLGGSNGSIKDLESYKQTFVVPPSNWNIKNDYLFEGESYQGVVLDRVLDISSRRKDDAIHISWNIDNQILTYENSNGSSQVEIAVVQRKVEYPTVNGFGFDELYKISSSAGGMFLGDSNVQRAVRVKRRYRRALDENGNRIVDGLEIMKTYRVLDGIAGVEMPTSTTKSQIQLSDFSKNNIL